MDAATFDQLVHEMCAQVPADLFDGVTEVVVSPRVVPHPEREGIFTMGECIPLGLDGGGPDGVQSRVVLYHGSFRALAELDPEFDWRSEAWETLTHELRHHLEWRAAREDLEGVDRAAEQNFARHDGESFDPLFYLDGEEAAPGMFHVDVDWFLDHRVGSLPPAVEFTWEGRAYRAAVPDDATLPAFLVIEGVHAPPPGDLVVVVRRAPRFRDLLRPPRPWQGVITAHAVPTPWQPTGITIMRRE